MIPIAENREGSGFPRLVLIDAAEVEARLVASELKAALAMAFSRLASGQAVQPPQTQVMLPGLAGDFILYSAALDEPALFGVKVSPYLPALRAAGEVPVTAYTLLFSSATGEPVALCDSLALTTHRTAATTSLALDHLAPARRAKLAVIGAGPGAQAHVAYECDSRRWDQIAIHSPGLARDPARCAAIRERFPGISIMPEARQAVEDADVVMLCTSAGSSVIETSWLRDEVTVTSISTNAPRAHEIDPADLHGFDVFCDYRETAPRQAGEMLIAAERHGWDAGCIVADLPELVSGQAPPLRPGRRFFRSTGLGLEDITAAGLLLRSGLCGHT